MNADEQVDSSTLDLSDGAFEEYLNGGSALSRAYGEIVSPKVPQKIESVVLRRARALASLRALLQTQTWVRWSTPVALAACTVVMIAVLIQGVVPFMRAHAQLVMVQLGERPAPKAAAAPPSGPVHADILPEQQRMARTHRDRDERRRGSRTSNGPPTAASSEVAVDAILEITVSTADVPQRDDTPGAFSGPGF